MRLRRRHNRRHGPSMWAVALIVLSSCSGGAQVSSERTVHVTLKDFSIRTSTATVAAGNIVFDIYNRGPATHEFVVVRTDLPDDQLPSAADGLSVDEEALAGAGEISEVDIWTSYALELPLTPGRYVFFCNLEGHYVGGMTGTLVVMEDA
jgi:uncharacterized cupredoxin-like copper-binding protein